MRPRIGKAPAETDGEAPRYPFEPEGELLLIPGLLEVVFAACEEGYGDTFRVSVGYERSLAEAIPCQDMHGYNEDIGLFLSQPRNHPK
jgi:hypothetical protein